MIKFAHKKVEEWIKYPAVYFEQWPDSWSLLIFKMLISFDTWINKFSSIVPSKKKINRKQNAVVRKHLLTSWEATIKCSFDYIVQYTPYSVLTFVYLFCLFEYFIYSVITLSSFQKRIKIKKKESWQQAKTKLFFCDSIKLISGTRNNNRKNQIKFLRFLVFAFYICLYFLRPLFNSINFAIGLFSLFPFHVLFLQIFV